MKAFKLTLTALIFALVFTGCMKDRGDITGPDVEENVESVNDLVVPDNFDWKTQQTVQVFVQLPQSGELKPLFITNRDRTKRYFKGFPENSSSRTVSTKITIPAYVNELRLTYDGATGPNMAFILNETLMYDFNDANKKSAKSVTCDLSGYVTYSKGGWGQNSNGNNVGSLRDQYFDQVYPGDFVIGDENGYTITFEESNDVGNYLPGGGGPEVLSENWFNPLKKDKLGNLADQIIAARLNRDYSEAGVLGDSEAEYHLGELVYNDGPFEGMTVDAFLDLAQTALSGEGLNGYSVGQYATAAESIINSFHEGNNAGILTCPNDDDNGDGDDDDEGEDDDPYVEVSATCAFGDVIFTIENNGEDDMETSYSYSVTKNGSGIESGNYELDENQTVDVVVSGYNTDVFEMTVETPRNETLTEEITGCGDDEDNGGGGDDETDEQLQGTLAYEDLWPGKGDYDFNDLVIDYDFQITKNSQEIVQDITATFTVKAFGASLHNGFGFTLPNVLPGDIVSVTGYDVENTTVFTLAANGTESGQSNATFIVFDDARRVMPQTTGGIGVNTQLAYDYFEPVTVTLEIDFVDNAVTYSDLDIGSFNPFIIVNTVIEGNPGERGLEVHLPGYEPSDKFVESYFGQDEDASDPGAGEYFVTDNNLPWAINIAEGFDWVIEIQDITGAYNHFAEWAQSGGINYPDWYLDNSGYRNNNLIYPTQINQ